MFRQLLDLVDEVALIWLARLRDRRHRWRSWHLDEGSRVAAVLPSRRVSVALGVVHSARVASLSIHAEFRLIL